jgi:hypothetical protein
VFGVHYDTVTWNWAIPEEKLATTCMLLEAAMAAEALAVTPFRSLVGKLVHVKLLVPVGPFNIDKIMRNYNEAAKTEGLVPIHSGICF